MIVHLIDGPYQLFRHSYGLRRFTKGKDRPYGGVIGVLQTILQIIESVKGSTSPVQRDTYLGVATDHIIESFRNQFGRTTRPARGLSLRCERNFIRSKRHWRQCAWSSGR